MDLEHSPSKQLKKRKTASYILFGACARGLGCRCFHRGDAAGFGACGRCLFHHGCVASTTEQCAACHIAVGELDTSRFETCWMQGCSAKAGDLCAKCSSKVSETIKRQVEAIDEMSWSNFQAAVAKYPGLEQLPPVLQAKVAEKMLALMASDWKFAVDRSKKV